MTRVWYTVASRRERGVAWWRCVVAWMGLTATRLLNTQRLFGRACSKQYGMARCKQSHPPVVHTSSALCAPPRPHTTRSTACHAAIGIAHRRGAMHQAPCACHRHIPPRRPLHLTNYGISDIWELLYLVISLGTVVSGNHNGVWAAWAAWAAWATRAGRASSAMFSANDPAER